MCQIALVALLLGVPGGPGEAPSTGTTYYVDDDGSDRTGDGSVASPWGTLGHAAALMDPGDICVVRAGTYRETVRPKDGQTFRARPGEFVLVTGCDIAEGWRPRAGATPILEAAVAGPVREVFVAGRRMQLARHPNEDGDPFTSGEWAEGEFRRGAGTGAVDFEGGRAFPPNYWSGGFYSGVHGSNCYNSVFGRIRSSRGRSLTLTHMSVEAARRFPGFAGAGRGYIINHANALDAPGEWHWQDGTLSLWLPGEGGTAPPTVEAQVRLWGFDLSARSGVRLEGLHFKAASVLLEGAEDCVVDRCTFRHHAPWGSHYDSGKDSSGRPRPYGYCGAVDGTSGLHISGTGNVVRNCYVGHAWGAGISVRGDSCVVENCIVEDVGWIARQGSNPIVGTGRDNRISRNTIRRTASTGIRLVQIGETLVKRPRIELNDVRETGLILVDGGSSAIYLSNHDAPTDDRSLDGGIIARNFVGRVNLDSGEKGFGIYLDDGTDHAMIYRNEIAAGGAIRWGIFLHYATHIDENIVVAHNTVWGYRGSAIAASGHPQRGGVNNVVIRNNHAQKGGFEADVVDHNRANVPASEFLDVEGHDFRIRDRASASVDAGVAIDGLRQVPDGKPDLGARELGDPASDWRAGADFRAPTFPDGPSVDRGSGR